MATVEMKKATFSVRDAAERFNRTTARIRQICIEHGIGKCHGDRFRELSRADIAKIGRIIEEFGYEKTS